MNSRPRTIVKAKKEDLSDLFRFFALLEGETTPSEEELLTEIDRGGFYLLKSGTKIQGVASISHDVIEVFFPDSHSYRKSDDLLERIGYRGEPLCVLTRFAISPLFRRKGLGSEFLQSLLARYKGSTWLTEIRQNTLHAIPFFQKNNFSILGIYPPIEGRENESIIVYKTYKKDGLCSASWW